MVTNSVPVIAELVSDDHVNLMNLIAVGAAIRKQVHAMVGELARRAFASMHADVLFLGAGGFAVATPARCYSSGMCGLKYT